MKTPEIFITSSLDHMPQSREVMEELCKTFNAHPVYFPATPPAHATWLKTIKPRIENAAAVFVPLCSRYGPLVSKAGKSLAHLQLEHALQLQKHLAFFIASHVTQLEQQSKAELDGYRALVELAATRCTNPEKVTFSNNTELKLICYASLSAVLSNHPGRNSATLVSSAFRGLEQHRKAVIDALNTVGVRPLYFETLINAPPEQISRKLVDDADIYFGLLDHRYGDFQNPLRKSYTHIEFEAAVAKPCMIAIFEPKTPRSHGLNAEGKEAEEKKSALQAAMRRQPVRYSYEDPTDLAAKALEAVFFLKKPRPSSVPFTNDIPEPPVPFEAHPYGLLEQNKLIGRTDEISLLNAWARGMNSPLGNASVVCIEALGGMGKSAVAWTWFTAVTAQPKSFEAAVWWSFYHLYSDMDQLILHTLAYLLRRDPAAIASETPSPTQRSENLLDLLHTRRVLLVLDGLERRLALYTEMGAIRHEHADLDKIVAEVQENYRRIMSAAPSSPEIHLEARKYYRRMQDSERRFIQRLCDVKASSTLITTRFFPSDLENEQDEQPRAGVKSIKLNRFDAQSMRSLWEDRNLAWSSDMETLLVDQCGGYPLYGAVLAQAIAARSGAVEEFNRWQKNLNIDRSQLSKENARLSVVLFGLEGLSPADEQLLAMLAFNQAATPFEFLVAEFVGPAKPFEDVQSLYHALRRVRERKLVGLEADSGSFDIHPLVRHAIRRNRPELMERIAGKIVANKPTEVQPVTGKILRLGFELAQFVRQFDGFLFLKDYKRAAQYLRHYLYNSIRFHSREFLWLDHHLLILFEHKEQLSTEICAWLFAVLADSQLLQNRCKQAYAISEQAVEAARIDGGHDALAMALLQRAHAHLDNANFLAAETDLHTALRISESGKVSEGVTKWLWCNLGSLMLLEGQIEQANQCLAAAQRCIGDGEHDTDCMALERRSARQGGRQDAGGREGEIRARYDAATAAQGLGLSSLKSLIWRASAAVDAGDYESALQIAHNAMHAVSDSGYLAAIPDIQKTIARAHFRSGNSGAALLIMRQLIAQARESDARHQLAHALTFTAQIEAANGSYSEIPQLLDEAFEIARGQGSPYCDVELIDHINQLSRQFNTPARSSNRAIATFEAPELPDPPLVVVKNVVVDDQLPKSDFDDDDQASPEHRMSRLEQIIQPLDWSNATRTAKAWWDGFVRDNIQTSDIPIRLALQLLKRQSTITEFFLARLYSHVDNLMANLHYLDYARFRNAAQSARSPSAVATGERQLGGKNLEEWADKVISERASNLQITTDQLTSDNKYRDRIEELTDINSISAASAANTFWAIQKDKLAPNAYLAILIRLCEINASAADFYNAFTDAQTDDVPAIFAFLQYIRLKKREDDEKQTGKRNP